VPRLARRLGQLQAGDGLRAGLAVDQLVQRTLPALHCSRCGLYVLEGAVQCPHAALGCSRTPATCRRTLCRTAGGAARRRHARCPSRVSLPPRLCPACRATRLSAR
jgi:hypothetical protein